MFIKDKVYFESLTLNVLFEAVSLLNHFTIHILHFKRLETFLVNCKMI